MQCRRGGEREKETEALANRQRNGVTAAAGEA
jgi:hypothetical protein